MKEKKTHAGNVNLLGGRLCLDFANTVGWRIRNKAKEYLNNFNDLVVWSQHAGILKAHEAKRLSKVAESHPSEVELVYNHAIALREILFRIFSSVADGGSASKTDLAALNQNLSKTMARSRIVKSMDGFTWDLDFDKNALDWVLQPIVRSAADLLVSDELKRVKKCAAEDCGWLFLDVSRNQSRRWCNMKDCGNRAKAGRFYKKKKEALGTS